MSNVERNGAQFFEGQVDLAKQWVGRLPHSARWKTELEGLQRRIARRERVVAVFGAFSAGKSSLLNALLGKSALAVSPNPTTATVSHLYADAKRETGSAIVYAKSKEQMWEDVLQAFRMIHQEPKSFEEAIAIAQQLKMADFSPAARKSVSFLMAVAKGHEVMYERLDTSWTIPEAEVRMFTAEERFACYVQRVDIVQDTNVLQQGFVFVDTPGVDSIHRRHTDVAFDYMRKADAIIFVLYYTHAFSRADKDFLQQLAGVQDVAGSNKLFVVINAVDLAKSDDERTEVRERVISELKQVGIRLPRVFEVSSQLAFAGHQLAEQSDVEQFTKLARLRLRLADETPLPDPQEIIEQSGIQELLRATTHFVEEQSEQLMQASFARTMQSIGEQVASGAKRVQHLATDEAAFVEKMRHAYGELITQLGGQIEAFKVGDGPEIDPLVAEFDELVFHAGERIRLRFSNLFREAFHPGRFRVGGDGRQQLKVAADEFLANIGKQIEIEARTFALRAESALTKAVQSVRIRNHQLMTSLQIDGLQSDVIDFVPSLANQSFRAELSESTVSAGFKYFSSAKQFFEGTGAQEMMAAIMDGVIASARKELERLTKSIRESGQAMMTSAMVVELASLREAAEMACKTDLAAESSAQVELWHDAAKWFTEVAYKL